MPISVSPTSRLLHLLIAAPLLGDGLSGCATPASSSRAALLPARWVVTPAIATGPSARAEQLLPAHWIPVVRSGRYTLVELSPGAGQADLLQQVVDISMPATLSPTVGDAVRFVLLRSGLTLCSNPSIRILNALPLPAADLHLGPMTLGNALRVLVGPGWHLTVNEVTRMICFTPLTPLPHSGAAAVVPPMTSSEHAPRAQPIAVRPEHRP